MNYHILNEKLHYCYPERHYNNIYAYNKSPKRNLGVPSYFAGTAGAEGAARCQLKTF